VLCYIALFFCLARITHAIMKENLKGEIIMERFTTKDGKLAAGKSSEEAFKKLAWHENDEEAGNIPEEYIYAPGKTPGPGRPLKGKKA